jgi:hypothetical protein
MMSDPCSFLLLDGSPEARGGGRRKRVVNRRAAGGLRLGANTVRWIENWIVGVVTVLSAGVIFLTLLADHHRTASADSASQATIGAAEIHR